MDLRVPRGNLTKPGELSPLTSRREPGGISHNWRSIAASQTRNDDAANTTSQLAVQVNRLLAGAPFAGSGMFPFKIYQLPVQYRANAAPLADPSTAWRAVRVRNGLILNSTISPTSGPCGGTDQIDQPWYDVFTTQASGTLVTGVTDIIVPVATAAYYIWVDITGNSISYGANPASPDHGSAWTGWPAVNSGFQLIGWVDTNTVPGRALIRQVQGGDIISTGSGGGTTISAFTIASSGGLTNANYWVGTPVGGGSNVNIAKAPRLQNSITTLTIDGNTWTYSYTSTIERTATNGSYSEYQRISPRPLIGDLIFAANVGATATGVSGVIWQDLNVNGYAWAPNVNQSGP